jgi:hypothetical protein
MEKILLVLNFMAEFLASETGFVRQRHGLPVAWTAGVLVAAAVILGMPGKAEAYCRQFPGCAGDAACAAQCQYSGCATGWCHTPNECVCY